MQINLRSICHLNIPHKFFYKEKDGCLPFLDVNIFREQTRNLQLTTIEKRPSVGFIPTSKVFKHNKIS